MDELERLEAENAMLRGQLERLHAFGRAKVLTMKAMQERLNAAIGANEYQEAAAMLKEIFGRERFYDSNGGRVL